MSDSIIRPIPDRIEHLGSDLQGILRATGDGQPPTVAVPGEHYATPEALASGLEGKADLVHSHAGLSTAIPAGRVWVGRGDGVPGDAAIGEGLSLGTDLGISDGLKAALGLSHVTYANTLTQPGCLDDWTQYGDTGWTVYPDGVGSTLHPNHAFAVRDMGHTRPRITVTVCSRDNNSMQPAIIPLWLDQDNLVYVDIGFRNIWLRQNIDGGEPQTLDSVDFTSERIAEWTRVHIEVSRRGPHKLWVSAWASINPGGSSVQAVVDNKFQDATWCGIWARSGGRDNLFADFVIRRGGRA